LTIAKQHWHINIKEYITGLGAVTLYICSDLLLYLNYFRDGAEAENVKKYGSHGQKESVGRTIFCHEKMHEMVP